MILGDVPLGTRAADAHAHVRLVMLANDITLRNLVPDELAKGFGFFQSKPATAFSPFAVTPDELGDGVARRPRAPAACARSYNGTLVGDPDAGEMHFSFFDLDRAHRAHAGVHGGHRSWAAARCRTPTARAACRAWPSGGRSRLIDGGQRDDAVHGGRRHDRDRDARRRRARRLSAASSRRVVAAK